LKKLIWLLLIVALTAGCSKEPTPQDRFAEYIKLWNEQKFDKMYDYLTNGAKEVITKEDFTARYEKIYKDLEITDLKVTFKKPSEEEKLDKKVEKVDYDFSASMNSIAGKIEFTHNAKLKKEERDKKNNWYVNWNTTYIFPELKDGDKIGIDYVQPKRGEILDRAGNGMAVNGQVYQIGVIPEILEGQENVVLPQLASLLKMSREQIDKALNANWVKPDLFVPLKKVSMDDRERIAQLVALEPVRTMKVEARIYPYKESAAHLIGYVGSITAEELEELKGKGYTSNDMIGKRGLEQVFDERLKGKPGTVISIKKPDDTVFVLAEKEVEDGENVKLTIDGTLQLTIWEELKDEAGSSAAINPTTGETLALVSSPSFDPNQAVLGFSSDEWKALQENEKQPLSTRFNKAYAPGSVIKPLSAAIGLANKAITPEKTVDIKGMQWQKSESWGGYFVTRIHEANPVNLRKALVLSDNIYFAQNALAVGEDKFVEGMKSFGFEEELDYPFPLQKSTIGTINSEIALADSGYGQGQVQMGIVHLLSTYTPFVNKGNMIKPTLLFDDPKSQVLKEKVMSEDVAAIIASDMRQVVEDPTGTAHVKNMQDLPLAGKTGTAEIKQKQGETGTENGWFVAYNTNSPTLMIGMMIEGVQKRAGAHPVYKVGEIFSQVK
jgi:penicillin-binding protein 3